MCALLSTTVIFYWIFSHSFVGSMLPACVGNTSCAAGKMLKTSPALVFVGMFPTPTGNMFSTREM